MMNMMNIMIIDHDEHDDYDGRDYPFSGDNDCRGDYLVIPRGWGGTSPNNKAFGRDRSFEILIIMKIMVMMIMMLISL